MPWTFRIEIGSSVKPKRLDIVALSPGLNSTSNCIMLLVSGAC